MNTTIVMDIETRPDVALVAKNTKAFDPESVKLGNTKDPDKVDAKIAQAEAKYWEDAYGKAALDPHTSTICAIGIQLEDEDPVLLYGSEKSILERFWDTFEEYSSSMWCYYTGNNGKGSFDMRHILVRSWVNKVRVPWGVVSQSGYISAAFVDLAMIYLAGSDFNTFCGLDRCAKVLGLHGEDVGFATVMSKEDLKELGASGACFHELLDAGSELADTYLINDLALTRAVAGRLV